MEVGPPGPPCGGRFQTTHCCVSRRLCDTNAEARQGKDGGLVTAVLHGRWRLSGPPEPPCGRRLQTTREGRRLKTVVLSVAGKRRDSIASGTDREDERATSVLCR